MVINMLTEEKEEMFRELDLSYAKASHYLGVNQLTARRWLTDPEGMISPAKQTLKGWRELKSNATPWNW